MGESVFCMCGKRLSLLCSLSAQCGTHCSDMAYHMMFELEEKKRLCIFKPTEAEANYATDVKWSALSKSHSSNI